MSVEDVQVPAAEWGEHSSSNKRTCKGRAKLVSNNFCSGFDMNQAKQLPITDLSSRDSHLDLVHPNAVNKSRAIVCAHGHIHPPSAHRFRFTVNLKMEPRTQLRTCHGGSSLSYLQGNILTPSMN